MLTIAAETLDGRPVTVECPSSATVGDLRRSIGASLDVPYQQLQLTVGSSLLPADESALLEAAGIEDGTRVSAVVRSRPPLPALADTLKVELLSSRMRLGSRRNSSAFTMIYTLQMDLVKSSVHACMMRKNDNDVVELDGRKGTCKGQRGHWMAGDTQVDEAPLFSFDLAEVLHQWMDKAEVISDSAKQLWTLPSEGMDLKGSEGWFVAPSADCVELYVDAPFPVSNPGAGSKASLRIGRVLLDASGSPVRAALYHTRNSNVETQELMPKADVEDMARDGDTSFEEYDVKLTQ